MGQTEEGRTEGDFIVSGLGNLVVLLVFKLRNDNKWFEICSGSSFLQQNVGWLWTRKSFEASRAVTLQEQSKQGKSSGRLSNENERRGSEG